MVALNRVLRELQTWAAIPCIFLTGNHDQVIPVHGGNCHNPVALDADEPQLQP